VKQALQPFDWRLRLTPRRCAWRPDRLENG